MTVTILHMSTSTITITITPIRTTLTTKPITTTTTTIHKVDIIIDTCYDVIINICYDVIINKGYNLIINNGYNVIIDVMYSFGVTDGGVEQHPVPVQEFLECVTDGVTGFPDPDGLDHAGVSKLPVTELPIEQLHHTETVNTQQETSGTTSYHSFIMREPAGSKFIIRI